MRPFDPTQTLIIRPMSLTDLPQVQSIDRESFSLPWPESAFRYEIQDNQNSICRVAERQTSEEASQIVGMIVVWLIVDEAHIATLATHPDFRQQGIARKLLADTLLECIQSGARSATLEVRAHNETAQALYQQFGFVPVGRRPRYYQDNQEDALLMTAQPLDEAYRKKLLHISRTGKI
jgi:ribosomal-protein-alanine N-acetyltransferase